MNGDIDIGKLVLLADWNWRNGPNIPAMLAFFLGRRERFCHLNMALTIAWWRDRPYLIFMREAG